MRRTNPANLLLVAVAVATLIAFGMQFGAAFRHGLAVTSWIEWVAILFLAAVILRLGYSVRAFQKGNKPNLDPIRAARTLALAKVGALTGAVLLGRYGAVVMVTAADWNFGTARRIVMSAAIAALTAFALIVASLIAEKWCELPPSAPEPPPRRQLLEIPEASTAYLKKTSALVAAALLAVPALLSGCTYASEMIGVEAPGAVDLPVVTEVPEIAALVPEAIRADGKLTIASELSYAPMEFVGADGRSAVGLDIDIANAIAAVLGLQPEILSSSFDAIIPALGTRYELGVSAFTITGPRLEAVNMVSYLEAGSQLAVRAGNPDAVDAADLCGTSIAVQIGTVQQEELEALNRVQCANLAIKIFPYESQADVTANLLGGRVSAMYADSPITGYAVAQTDNALTELGEIVDAAPYGIVIAKHDVELATAVHAAVRHLIETGAMAQIAEHWGNSQMLLSQSELRVQP
jgi:polar amino acid transport system substrate-binding protein